MSAERAHKQLFELWHQASLSDLTVTRDRVGLTDAVHPDAAEAFLQRAQRSWQHPAATHGTR